MLSWDALGTALLVAASAAFVVWQNAHLTVLWDTSYTLETSARIALGQIPYRDFPLAHAPLTFLIQAVLIRLAGRVFWHAVAWAAVAGAASAVLAWRLVRASLEGSMRQARAAALALCAPLIFLSVYAILPFPSYDCDAILAVLVFLAAWTRGMRAGRRLGSFFVGVLLVPPLFFKQNIGLALAVCAVLMVGLMLAARMWHRARDERQEAGPQELLLFLSGAATAALLALVILQGTVGLDNYIHWTIRFAAQRRMPGLGPMLAVYREPMLAWELPAIIVGLAILWRSRTRWAWTRWAGLALLAAPFVWTLAGQALGDDAEDRATSLLSLWPLLLILAAALALIEFAHCSGAREVVPFLALAAIHGAMLSQQLWGSTYALWPLLAILLARQIGFVARVEQAEKRLHGVSIASVLAAVVGATLLIAGSLYATSEERLFYADVFAAPLHRAAIPALRGMTVGGDYLPEFEELLAFAEHEIPREDGVILLPGEEPFYFATGRAPRFPVLLFDPATDPYSAAQLSEEARLRQIRWLIVKRHLQSVENPLPQPEQALAELMREFHPYCALRGYDVYRSNQ